MSLKMYNIKKLLCGLLLLSTYAQVLTSQNITSKVSSQRVAEGGALPEESGNRQFSNQEHDANKLNNTATTIKSLNNTQAVNTTNKISSDKSINNSEAKPVIEKPTDIEVGVPKKNDEKQSVGKKGVSFSDNDNVSLKETTSVIKSTSPPVEVNKNLTTPNIPIPKKPLITVRDDYVFNQEESAKSDPIPKIPIDKFIKKNNNRANYVIPIVAVILSVPLVAIIISVLYKRGTDWWQHRNYRRMDFLIEGMYNN